MANNWIPPEIDVDVRSCAKVFYIDLPMRQRWNAQRRAGELLLLCGWAWESKDGKHQRQGFKTRSVCTRDAWYTLVKDAALPRFQQGREFKGRITFADIAPAPRRLVAAE